MNFKNFFKNLINIKTHPAHLPYVPSPPSHQADSSQNPIPNDTSYTEEETSIHTIAGTGIGFGKRKFIQVDNQGQAKDLSQSQSHIIGTGRIVNKVEDIAGICPFCQLEAKEAFDKGLLSFQEAQSRALYDTQSDSQCDICGTNTCSVHCRPIQMPNDIVQQLCVACQKHLKKQLLKQKIIGFLLSPFIEER